MFRKRWVKISHSSRNRLRQGQRSWRKDNIITRRSREGRMECRQLDTSGTRSAPRTPASHQSQNCSVHRWWSVNGAACSTTTTQSVQRHVSKARFPLPELTARVNGPSWQVTGFHYPSTRPVNSASENARPSTRPVLTGNGNRSPANSGRQLG